MANEMEDKMMGMMENEKGRKENVIWSEEKKDHDEEEEERGGGRGEMGSLCFRGEEGRGDEKGGAAR